jgi:hypothetical protein
VLSYSTAHAVWLNLVGKHFGKTGLVHGTSEHCPWAPGGQTILSYQTRMYFDLILTGTVLVKSSLPLGIWGAHNAQLFNCICFWVQFGMAMLQ